MKLICSLSIRLLVLATLASYSCAERKPNIVLIVSDDLGWSDVGYQKIGHVKTPNIDRLAREGVILDNYYVQHICTPTRSALLTGRYPIHTGMQEFVIRNTQPYGLPLEFDLLPQKLKEAGYSTHMVGKWHLGFYKWEYTPTYRGFDTFYGFYLGHVDHYSYKGDGVLDLRDQKTPVLDAAKHEYSANLFAEKAKEVIYAQDSDAKPMFLYLPFASVHEPVQAPKRFLDMYKDIASPGRRGYLAMVSAMDEAIAKVTDALKEKGMWENTLLIFTTDNGGIPIYGGYNWPLRGMKGTLWEGGVKGVGFVHGEMINSKGRRCLELLHVTDWYPTILGLAGIDTSKEASPLDGKNVWETISNGAPSPRTEILHNIDLPGKNKSSNPLSFDKGIALRSGDMKLLMSVIYMPWFKPPELGGRKINRGKLTIPTVKVALFNITADPEERHDLSRKLPDVVDRLRERVKYYMKTTKDSVKKPADPVALKTAEEKGYWGPWRSSLDL